MEYARDPSLRLKNGSAQDDSHKNVGYYELVTKDQFTVLRAL